VAVSTYAGLHKPPPHFHSPSPSPTRPPPPRVAGHDDGGGHQTTTTTHPTLAGDGGPARRRAKRSSQLLRPGSWIGAHDSRAWARGARGGSAQLAVEGLHGGSRRWQPWSSPACPPGGARPVGRQHPGARLLARPAELAYLVVGAELVHWADGALELACSAARRSSHARLSGQRRSIRSRSRSIRRGFAQGG
jgi:hypothetical protein